MTFFHSTFLTVLLGLQACSTQDFSGDAGTQRVVKSKPPIKTGPNKDIPLEEDKPVTPSSEIVVDDGGAALKCDPTKMVEDPNAVYQWSSKLRAGDDISWFVNSFNRYTRVNVGALFFDAATAKFACQLNGYLDQIGFTEGSFASPGNNNTYRWEPTQRKLLQVNAASSGNKTLKTYSCRGKLKDPCRKDAGWIFQPPP